MARHIEHIHLDKPDDFVLSVMNKYLQKNGFSLCDRKGESVYRAGDRYLDGFRYIKWSYIDGTLNLEAWIAGPFDGEWGLKGFVNYSQKQLYKRSLEKLAASLQEIAPVYSNDGRKAALFSFAFGALALVCMNPAFCLVFAPISTSLAQMGLISNLSGWARAGRICAIVSLLTTSIVCLMNLSIQLL